MMHQNNFKITQLTGELPEGFNEFAKLCIQETQFKQFGMKIDPEVFVNTIYDFTHTDNKCFFLAVDLRTNHPIGCLLGLAQRHPFSIDMCANELYFFVLPEYRKQGLSKLLISHFENWAALHNCKSMIVGIGEVSSKEGASSNEALQRMGFKLFYTGYHKRVG